MQKIALIPHVSNEDQDQPAHLHNLIKALTAE